MNREIKFRCWDKDFNEFSDYHMNRILAKDIKDNKRFIFSEFTGLKDKNGKEIYEGDIVKAEWHWQDGKIVDLSYESEFFYSVQEYAIEDVLEIIGNIYQTPELLETVQK